MKIAVFLLNWKCAAKSPRVSPQNSTALDPLRKEEERKTKDNIEEDSRKRDENHEALLGVIELTRLTQDRQGWRSFVAALHTTGCNG